jgi:hypothetical protein
MVEIAPSGPRTGRFVISLDFELMWGVRDKRSIADYGRNILGVRQVVPALLALFAERGIACTWATVGMLFFAKKRDLLAALPERRPLYADPRLSPYEHLSEIGDSEATDPYWYGLSMIERIKDCPRQEIGTHTFSHFYCLEQGGDTAAFRADLEAARAAAASQGVAMTSIVFPRNQTSPAHLAICRDLGLRAFRGNERIWFHRAGSGDDQTLVRRGFRLADSFLPLGGAYDRAPVVVDGLIDVASSRFLRPASGHRLPEDLRLKRITSAMATAAERKTVFHLWWHPHNFGVETERNLAFLRAILDRFRDLEDRHGMRSMTMAEIANEALDDTRTGRPAYQ